MKRDFKFRVWIPDLKKFEYCDYIPTMGFVWTSNDPIEVGEESPEQFVGLYDKRSNPIFEGDILLCYFTKLGEIVCVMDYAVPSFVFRYGEGYFDKRAFPMDIDGMPEKIEIIGNVHQNPELLK